MGKVLNVYFILTIHLIVFSLAGFAHSHYNLVGIFWPVKINIPLVYESDFPSVQNKDFPLVHKSDLPLVYVSDFP